MTALLEVEGMTKAFGGLVAVGNMSLAISAGEVLGLIGPNGSGKTTLLNLIAGSIRADAGTIRMAGEDVTRLHRVIPSGQEAWSLELPEATTSSPKLWRNNVFLAAPGHLLVAETAGFMVADVPLPELCPIVGGSPFLDDIELYENGVIRIYDVLFPATVLLETDAYIRDFLVRAKLSGAMSTAEFHYRLGQDLLERNPACAEYSVVAQAAKSGVPIYTSSPGDSSIGMNIAYHELMNGGTLMIDPNRDVNEVCAIILAGRQNGCVILGGGSPKNFYLQGQPTLWEVYGIPKGGNDYFIQFTTDQVVWGGLSGATPSEAVSWGKVNPGVLPDTVVAYCDSTIAFPLFCEYAVGSEHQRRERRQLVHKRDALVDDLHRQAKSAGETKAIEEEPAEIDRHR